MSEAIEGSPRLRPPKGAPGRRRAAAVLALLGGLAAAGFIVHRYKGMSEGMWRQARYATFTENRNLGKCIAYWLKFMQKLTFDRSTGRWSFDQTPTAGLDDFERGQLAFHRGEFAQAVALLEHSLAEKGESEEGLFWLAMASMRLAEAENCLAPLQTGPGHGHAMNDRAFYCSLPLLRPHQRTQYSQQAVKLFERLLDRYDPDNQLYRWLLNFSAMAVAGFPQQVPERYRIATPFIDAFYGTRAEEMRRRYSWLRFTDRAQELGIENFGAGRGVAVEDFDRDGFLDVMATGRNFGVTYYHNEGGTRFTALTDEVGLGGLTQPFTISAADFDNDGWMDLLVVLPFDHYRLFHNQGGRFVDVTASSGLLDPKPADAIAASWITTWADVDNDGDLDLFVANWAFRMPFLRGVMAKPRMSSTLFINDGNGHFHDGTAEFGLADLLDDRYFIGATFGDVDNDGFPDLYLSSPLRGTSVLLHNVTGPAGGRRFVPVEGISRHEPGFSAAFVDVNHDGRLDIFQAGFGDARTSILQSVFGQHVHDYKTGHSTVLLQKPDGGFEEHNDFFGGGTMPMGTMGAAFGDLNNDGCYDFYLGTGNPEPWFILPNLMYLGEEKDGRCTGRMENISMLNGFGNVQKGHGIVFFDFDNDGDQDIFSSLGGMWPSDRWMSQLFVNESVLHNQWVKIRLRGRQTNRYGVGASLKVTARTADGHPIVRTYRMDQGTGFGGSPYLAHIGLANATSIDGVEVFWPVSRCRHVYAAKPGQLNVLDEADCPGVRRRDV
jgi:tetratricopeptide (TPR) repeat protein